MQPGATPLPAPRMTPRWLVVLIACLFAALIPETLLTSSTSPARIVGNPFALVFIALFYGTADVLVRELIVRRHIGWAALLLLGVAFGFVNEGVIAGTWYTVRYSGYVFYNGVDVAWAFALTVFHIFYSVIVPVTFIDLLFPRYAGRSLLGKRGIIAFTVIFAVLALLGPLAPNFRADRSVALAAATIITLVAVSLRSAPPRQRSDTPAPRLWPLRLAGFFVTLGYFVAISLVPVITAALTRPRLILAQALDVGILGTFVAVALVTARPWTGRAEWGPRQNLALISGALAFTALLSVTLPPLIVLLEPVATVPFFVLLVVLARRHGVLAARRQAQKKQEEAYSIPTGVAG